jgi:hypothetical protein
VIMEDTTACFPEKKRTASTAFGPTVEQDDNFKEEKEVQSHQCAPQSGGDWKFAETLATPTVKECVCFLEKNTSMRQIIGLLIELEEGQDGKESSTSNDISNDDEPRAASESESSVGYDDSSDLGLDEDEWHYTAFLSIKPHVSRRDLAATGKGGDDDHLNKTQCGLKDDSDNSENEYNKGQDDHDDSAEAPLPQSDIPTLQELAVMKVSAQFQEGSKINEQHHQDLLAALLKQTHSQVTTIYQHSQEQLKASAEWLLVSLLELIITTAKNKLDVRSAWHHREANSGALRVIQGASKRRAEIRRNWLSERQSILDDHSSFLAQYKPDNDGDGDNDGNAPKKKLLCLLPVCRKLFTPHQLDEENRCMVPGCMSTLVNCGCGLKPCPTCRGPMCKDHIKSSAAHACSDRARRTCGCSFHDHSGGFVKDGYCHRVFDDEVHKQCSSCETRGCAHCLTECPDCSVAADCKDCLKSGYQHECPYDD